MIKPYMQFRNWKRSIFGNLMFVAVFTVYLVLTKQSYGNGRRMEDSEKLAIIEETTQQSDVPGPIIESNEKFSYTDLQIYRNYPTNHLSFKDVMAAFPWSDFQASLKANDLNENLHFSTTLLLKLVEFLKRPPLVSVDSKCKTPQISPETRPCHTVQHPRKVGILLQFGFDVDTLEIHLHELNETVDYFFLIESIKPHGKFSMSKPLMWEIIKYDDRFIYFASKIVHFIVDDANLSALNKSDNWARESLQEGLRWRKFLEWNQVTNYFGDDDLLGFGDVDEVPDRSNVAYLKNCQRSSDPVDIGIWFPYDGIDTVFKTDFPVKDHRFTLGDPTFWTVASAMNYFKKFGKPPNRMRGKSKSYLLGGMHLSRYAYPPFQMAKRLTASEADLGNFKFIIEVGLLYSQNKSSEAETVLNTVPPKLIIKRKLESLRSFSENNKTESDSVVKMPWFLNCNRQRYPAFDKEHDKRLDAP